ncbi:MAG: hypothetical protein WCC04_21730 [Terriglobales bacterium]
MDRRAVLPPIRSQVRKALMDLADFQNIATEQLKEMAGALPGGRKVYLPDRLTTIAFLLGTQSLRLISFSRIDGRQNWRAVIS